MHDAGTEEGPRTELHLREMPGGAVLCDRIREGTGPWAKIRYAISYCTWFPNEEFAALLLAGDFDVRWPLTFAAWYEGSSGASVDSACADFLASNGLW